MTARAQFVALASMQSVQWLQACIAAPGPYMKPRHIALIRIALRRMGA